MKTLKLGELEVQGIYGFLRSLQPALRSYSMLAPVVLWDGISWRRSVYPEYKSNRDKEPETKAEIEYQRLKNSLRQQRPYIAKALRLLGVPQMIASNLEADDLAGILVRRYRAQGKRALMMTGDKDWIQLVGPGVGWLDPVNNVRITEKVIAEKLGVKNGQAWLEVKALMGDPSDAIPGVGGIGEKGAKDLVNAYGSVTSFINQYQLEKLEVPKKFKDLAEQIEKQDAFHRNLKLMDLSAAPVPENLKLNKGQFDEEKVREMFEELSFRSILMSFEDWCEPFRSLAS